MTDIKKLKKNLNKARAQISNAEQSDTAYRNYVHIKYVQSLVESEMPVLVSEYEKLVAEEAEVAAALDRVGDEVSEVAEEAVDLRIYAQTFVWAIIFFVFFRFGVLFYEWLLQPGF